jgi:hypothetical protein
MMTLCACYDLEHSPPTYDFIGFLLSAELERLRRGLKDFRVAIIPGSAGGFRPDNLPPYTIGEREQMRDRIVVPMATLLPSCAGVEVRSDRSRPEGDTIWFGEKHYGTGLYVAAYAKGLFPLRAPSPVARDPYVTITLREASYWPTRNSNVSEWLKVGAWLRSRGLRPVFVRDSAKTGEGLPFDTDHRASVDLVHRANLYAGAVTNLFVSNGPAWMCMAMGAPMLVCKMVAPNAPAVSPGFFAAAGMPVGTQIAGTGPHQRILWEDDRAGRIIDELKLLSVA